MQPISAPSRIAGPPAVHNREGGSRGQSGRDDADAFRQALADSGRDSGRGSGDTDNGDGTAAEREPDSPIRRGLQPRQDFGRKQLESARHVDVIA